jgi:hypothetical protein
MGIFPPEKRLDGANGRMIAGLWKTASDICGERKNCNGKKINPNLSGVL